ncbi:MAG: IS5/IS1182 family transposase, partial [Tepidanaerobacteraceae bacterium]
GKRFYGLGLVMTRLQDTCETVIAMQLLVLNLERKLRILLAHSLSWLFSNQNGALCC